MFRHHGYELEVNCNSYQVFEISFAGEFHKFRKKLKADDCDYVGGCGLLA